MPKQNGKVPRSNRPSQAWFTLLSCVGIATLERTTAPSWHPCARKIPSLDTAIPIKGFYHHGWYNSGTWGNYYYVSICQFFTRGLCPHDYTGVAVAVQYWQAHESSAQRAFTALRQSRSIRHFSSLSRSSKKYNANAKQSWQQDKMLLTKWIQSPLKSTGSLWLIPTGAETGP